MYILIQWTMKINIIRNKLSGLFMIINKKYNNDFQNITYDVTILKMNDKMKSK